MFEELSLHILDIAMNSLAASARTVEITVTEQPRRDRLSICVRDDGCGMEPATLKRVLEGRPATTKRSRKKPIGLGLALLRQTAEMCGGEFHLESSPGAGTIVTATLQWSHVDRPPLGDLNTTMLALCAANPAVDVRLHYRGDGERFDFSSKEPAEKKVPAAPAKTGAAR
jgi:hypothetical protein